MTEPPSGTDPTHQQALVAPAAESGLRPLADDARPRPIDSARDACLALARMGTSIGWGLAALGLVAGLERVAGPVIDGQATSGESIRAWVGAGFAILAYGLAGFAAAVVARMTAAAIREYLDGVAHLSDDLFSLAARGVADLDRIAQVLGEGGAAVWRDGQSGPDRSRLLADFQRATRASQWAEARSLLDAFAADYPDDPRQTVLEAELEEAIHNAKQQQLARLEAAREVNDPEGVLESYQMLAGSLAGDARSALDRDLAKWFLALIHRRLRTTKIQPEVVVLASRFAEAFASTVEGASVRAALPTLRRSVGLCPRCGSPYAGIGDACPKCLANLSLRPPSPDSEAEIANP